MTEKQLKQGQELLHRQKSVKEFLATLKDIGAKQCNYSTGLIIDADSTNANGHVRASIGVDSDLLVKLKDLVESELKSNEEKFAAL